jgi:microcystin-dependent protein
MKKLLLTLLLASAALAHAAPAPTLIPFQGRLTDQAGTAYTNGQFTLIFNLYDQAVGGNVLWTETHQKVGVVNGMVNVFLGSINAALAGVDFSQTRYLGITIDADNNLNTPDPEMVPRQMIIPAFATKQAERARTMDVLDANGAPVSGQTYGWSSLFSNGNPGSGTISGAKLTPASVTSSQLANNAVMTANIADAQITAAKLAATPVIGTAQLVDGGVTLAKLAAAVAERLVPAGAVSAYAGTNTATPPAGWLFCDGRTVSRTTYAALFAAVGTAHGSGDGTTTFNLPDYRWTFLRGYGADLTVLGNGTASGNQATFPNHGFIRTGVKVRLSSGTLSGLAANTDYWAIVVDMNTLAFAASKANALANTRIALTGANAAVIKQWEDPDANSRASSALGGASGATVGSAQTDEFKRHQHLQLDLQDPAGQSRIVQSMGVAMGGTAVYVDAYRPAGNPANAINQTGYTGGNETRPQNVSVNYLIKY